jgi:uncharacterized membrane protein (DUF4010 family)
MAHELAFYLPPEGLKIVMVLFLSFLIGIEREESKAHSGHYFFGGVRTFPLIGLLGYTLALLSKDSLLLLAAGFVVVGALAVTSYLHKLSTSQEAGFTTEVTGLGTYLVGALVYHEHYWIATTLVVISMFLLELKEALESLTQRLPPEEIASFTKFLLLAAVILPVVPNKSFTEFQINPFKTWLIIVAVSGISYGSYVLQRATLQKGGVILTALFGGAYSSTITTVVLAKRAARENRPHLFAGAILAASGVMYVRLGILLLLFNGALLAHLWLPFSLLALFALTAGLVLYRIPDAGAGTEVKREYQGKNPLELKAAFLFAFIFLAALVVTKLVLDYLGTPGMYGLAAVMGVTDVDPFILGLTQSAGTSTPLLQAAGAILLTAASNNVVKGIYAFSFADRRTGVLSLAVLLALAALGMLPILFLS